MFVSTPPSSERRRDVRAPIELQVEYKRLNSFFADYTRNISRDGMFIKTQKPLGIGTEFVFKLQVPQLDSPLELHGRVQWTVKPEQANAEQEPGMGIGVARLGKLHADDPAPTPCHAAAADPRVEEREPLCAHVAAGGYRSLRHAAWKILRLSPPSRRTPPRC